MGLRRGRDGGAVASQRCTNKYSALTAKLFFSSQPTTHSNITLPSIQLQNHLHDLDIHHLQSYHPYHSSWLIQGKWDCLRWRYGLPLCWQQHHHFRRQNITDSAKQTLVPDSQKSTGDYAKDQASSTYDKAAGALQPGTCFIAFNGLLYHLDESLTQYCDADSQKSTTQKLGDSAHSGASDGKNEAQGYLQSAQKTVGSYADSAKKTAGEYTGSAQDTAGQYADSTKKTASDYTGAAQDKAGEYTDSTKKSASDYTGAAQNKVGEYTDSTKQTGSDYTGSIQKTIGDYAGTAQQKASEYTDAAKQNVDKTVDSKQSGNQSYIQAAQNAAADFAGSAQTTASQAVDGLSGVLKCMIPS